MYFSLPQRDRRDKFRAAASTDHEAEADTTRGSLQRMLLRKVMNVLHQSHIVVSAHVYSLYVLPTLDREEKPSCCFRGALLLHNSFF